VLLGRLEQGHQQFPVASLELGPLGERSSRLGDAIGEIVARALEVAETEHSRRAQNRLDLAIDRDAGKGLGCEPAQLALEAADLGAELSPRRALVDADGWLGCMPLSVQQFLHDSPGECR
jgi:hypothetical protein